MAKNPDSYFMKHREILKMLYGMDTNESKDDLLHSAASEAPLLISYTDLPTDLSPASKVNNTIVKDKHGILEISPKSCIVVHRLKLKPKVLSPALGETDNASGSKFKDTSDTGAQKMERMKRQNHHNSATTTSFIPRYRGPNSSIRSQQYCKPGLGSWIDTTNVARPKNTAQDITSLLAVQDSVAAPGKPQLGRQTNSDNTDKVKVGVGSFSDQSKSTTKGSRTGVCHNNASAPDFTCDSNCDDSETSSSAPTIFDLQVYNYGHIGTVVTRDQIQAYLVNDENGTIKLLRSSRNAIVELHNSGHIDTIQMLLHLYLVYVS